MSLLLFCIEFVNFISLKKRTTVFFYGDPDCIFALVCFYCIFYSYVYEVENNSQSEIFQMELKIRRYFCFRYF